MPAQPQPATTAASLRLRPDPLACIARVQTLARLWVELDLMRDYRPPSRGGSGGSRSDGAPVPVNVHAVEGKRRIERFTGEFLEILKRETGWTPEPQAWTPALVLELAQHIGRYTANANAQVAWAFAEELDLTLDAARSCVRAAWAERDARIPIGKKCDEPGCDGVYELRVRESVADADDAARERAFRRSFPQAACSRNSKHRSDHVNLDKGVPDAVTTKQLATWFGITRKAVLQRMRAAGVTALGEQGSNHEATWDRNVALVVMTRQRSGS